MNATTTSEPLTAVWDALDRCGCRPRGSAHKFAARCPAHDDRDPSLSVGVGVDGQALIHCHAGCDPESVVTALGLKWPDLFPAGHRQARRRELRPARRADFTQMRDAANVLLALERLGERCRVEIRVDCAYCGSPHALLIVEQHGSSFLHCEGECSARMFMGALAARLKSREAA